MRKFKLEQIGLALCGLCLSGFSAIFSDYICIIFFGEPDFPEQDD